MTILIPIVIVGALCTVIVASCVAVGVWFHFEAKRWDREAEDGREG